MSAQTLEYSAAQDVRASWLGKSFWSVLDQGLFSIANFAANILLANWLSKSAYGAFSVAFSYFLLLAIFHTAFLTEPALVFGAARYRGNLKAYLGRLIQGHFGLALLCAIVLGIAGLLELRFSNQREVGVAMISFAVALPFMLLLWLMRRTCYIDSQPRRAAAGDAVYLVTMLGGLALLWKSGHLSIISAVAIMAVCSLAASMFLIAREKPSFQKLDGQLGGRIRADHWNYGRWAAVTGIATYIPSQIYFPILEKTSGLESAGTLRALTNLVMPILQANVALCMLLLPAMVRARGTPGFNRIVLAGLTFLAGAPVIAWLLLGTFSEPLLHLIYRGKFNGSHALIWLIAFQPVVTGLFSVFHAALQAHHHPKYVFFASAAAAVASLTVGVGLTVHYGTLGAAIGMVVGFTTNALFAAYFCWRIIFSHQQDARDEGADSEVPLDHPEGL